MTTAVTIAQIAVEATDDLTLVTSWTALDVEPRTEEHERLAYAVICDELEARGLVEYHPTMGYCLTRAGVARR